MSGVKRKYFRDEKRKRFRGKNEGEDGGKNVTGTARAMQAAPQPIGRKYREITRKRTAGMKSKVNVEELAKRIDFESVSSRLEKLSGSGELKRRKTVADLLDKVRPALLQARERKVSYGALAQFLKESGIPVSEPTLRQYLKAQEEASGKRKSKRGASVKKSASKAVEKPEVAPKPEPEAENKESSSELKKLPPRLARRH